MAETTAAAPAIDLGRLTAAHMRVIIRLGAMSGTERAAALLDLLEVAVEGGLDAVPLTRLQAYLQALDAELEAVLRPKP